MRRVESMEKSWFPVLGTETSVKDSAWSRSRCNNNNNNNNNNKCCFFIYLRDEVQRNGQLQKPALLQRKHSNKISNNKGLFFVCLFVFLALQPTGVVFSTAQ
jgi:hypothetical protein